MLKNVLYDLEKLIEYWASADSVVSSNPWVGPLARIKKIIFSNDQFA